MEQSNCCGAGNWLESGICEQCKEHADFSDWEEEANERMKVISLLLLIWFIKEYQTKVQREIRLTCI